MKKPTMTVLFALAAVLFTAGLAACGGGHIHDFGEWTVTKEATCTEAGVRERICTAEGCNEVFRESIPALGHDWDAGEVIEPATCTTSGEQRKECARCHTKQTFVIPAKGHDWDEGEVLRQATCLVEGATHNHCLVCGFEADLTVPMRGHDWQRSEVTPATCEEAGSELYICRTCGERDERTLEKLGHRWTNGAVLEEATCTAEGRRELICTRCGHSSETAIPAAGHQWAGDYTIDVAPTFERDGEKSYHCTVCDERQGSVTIPKLDINTPIEYEFRILRRSGESLAGARATISVYEGGQKVAESSLSQISGGSWRTMLAPKEYTVTVGGLPEGYSAAASYTVTPYDPLCKLYVTASPIAQPMTASTVYQVGSVMHDFTVPSDSGTAEADLTLSALLQSKRAVILNFWYVNCPNCVSEFEGLENVYQKYRGVAEVIAIDPFDGLKDIRAFAASNGLHFPMVRDVNGLAKAFGVSGYPTTVVIDGEGVVTEIVVGATPESRFEALFAKYAAEDYFVRAAETALARTEYLPAKRP